MTWFEKIKQMDIEELAEFLESFRQCPTCRRYGNSCFSAYDTFDFLNSEPLEEQINHE